MSGESKILRIADDPHHQPYASQWGWDGSDLYHRTEPYCGKWVKVKRISFTPARVKALADLVGEQP